MLRLAIPTFLALIGMACTKSGLGDGGLLETDTDTDTDVTNPGSLCKWTGDWLLTNVRCSSFDIDEWFDKYIESHMFINDDGLGGGNCIVDFTWRAEQDACNETERWTMAVTSANDVDVVFGGITACNPDACVFPNDTDGCLIGDRSLATPMPFTFDDSSPGKILTAGLLAPAWVQCTLDLITEWTKQ